MTEGNTQMEGQSRSSRPKRRKVSSASALNSPRNIIWLGLTIISVSVFFAAAQVSASVRDIQTRVALLEQFGQVDSSPDLDLLQGNLGAVRADLAVIRADVGWLFPVLPAFRWLPRVGADVATAGDLFNMADALVRSADTMLGVGVRAAGVIGTGTAGQSNAIATLDEARPQLELARNLMNTAVAYRARIPELTLSARTRELLARVDRVLPSAQVAANAGLALPDLVGVDGARTYLVITQNEDERRATGGFVSSAGLISFERGTLTGVEFTDSYSVDNIDLAYPPAPAPLEKYMLAGFWLFRDANWSPDFPTSARQLAAFYEMGTGRHVDGVIAVDQEMVRLLVQAAGSIEVPGNPPKTVNGDNVLSVMRESWSPPANVPLTQAYAGRKSFIGNMAKSLQARFQSPDRPAMSAVARALYDALRGHHLLVYLPASPLSTTLQKIGWDGSVHSSPADYLMVVDSNVGFNKADALVARQYSYQVTIDSALAAHAALSMQYRHTGTPSAQVCTQRVPDYDLSTTYQSLMDLCYWDYLRVLVPSGAALTGATPHPIPAARMLNHKDSSGDPDVLAEANGRNAFGTLFMLDRGASTDVNFAYNLPAAVLQPSGGGMETYSLFWQKQPGAAANAVEFGLTLPPGSSVVQVAMPPAAALIQSQSADGLHLSIAFALDTDAGIDVQFRR